MKTGNEEANDNKVSVARGFTGKLHGKDVLEEVRKILVDYIIEICNYTKQ